MNRHRTSLVIVLALMIAITLMGCGSQGGEGGAEPDGVTPPQEETSGEDAGSADSGTKADMFVASERCSACHDGVETSSGEASFVDYWSPSVHSNAAVDPYYLATVRAETMTEVIPAEDVQKTCAPCHLGMADSTAMQTGASQAFLDESAQDGHELNALFTEAVSCMVCHQLSSSNTSIMSGEFETPFTIPGSDSGLRTLYGPYELADDMQPVMEGVIGYTSVKWNSDSTNEVCAPCHTLYTPTFNTNGEASGAFLPEQTPYYENMASDHSGQSCISCHMPSIGAGKMSVQSSEDVENLSSHFLLGPNSFMMEMVGDDSGKLSDNVSASQEFLKTAARVDASLTGNELTVDVISETGHKFPTAFPSRRSWVHVTAKDSSGQIIFESGGYDPDTGRITGADDGEMAIEPHHDRIDDPSQVQIYESFLGTSDGEPTTTLLYGTHYLKDNRILPAGFDAAKLDISENDVLPIGEAADDTNFQPGSDQVTYVLPTGAVSVDVEVLYQSISFHWAENLRTDESAEHTAFKNAYDSTANTPRVVASASVNQ